MTELNTQLNTQINTNQQQQSLRDLLDMEQQGMFSGAKASVTTPGPMNIDYLYDIGGSNIFATPQQAGMFASPYGQSRVPQQPQRPANTAFGPTPMAAGFAEGGQVEDDNDRLLRILGEM